MDVGVRELKQNLSRYLDRVAAGEIVQVTDRGRPKALLVPVPDVAQLDRGIQEGWIRPPRRAGLTGGARSAGSRSVADLLAEDRGE